MHGAASEKESQQLEELKLAIEDLRRRVSALERAAVPLALGTGLTIPETSSILETASLPHVSSGLVPALGRMLLGIGGAYLLRAISEAHVLPGSAGTALGLLYAAAWLASSLRISSKRRLSAALQAVTAWLIIAPLLWEATVRFHTLSPSASAAILSALVILGQIVGWRRDHSAVAGITALAGTATAIALIMATLDPLPFATGLVLASAVVEYGACRDRALAWRWILALGVDLCAFLLIFLVTRPHGLPEGYAPIPSSRLMALLIGLAVIFLSSVIVRTGLRGLPISWFEIVQVPVVIALSIAGVVGITHSNAAVMMTGGACLILSGLLYATALLRSGQLPSRNFQAYATFGLLLALTGGALLCTPLPLAALWSALAVAAVFVGNTPHARTLAMHGAVLLIAAAAQSGLLQYPAYALTGVNRALAFNRELLLCTLAAALCYGQMLRSRNEKAEPRIDLAARVLFAAVLSWGLAGLAAGTLARFSFEAPFASTIHTAVISALAVLLARMGRRWNLREMVWLLFPWMLFGAAKLLAEDFQRGSPTTLFLSLFIYGGTLIALPRLLKRTEPFGIQPPGPA